MRQGMSEVISRLQKCFPKGYVDYNRDFIAHRTANRYGGGVCFSLKTCRDAKEVACAVLEVLSYDCCKARPYKTEDANADFRSYMITGVNAFLGTAFQEKEFMLIYRRLGNRADRQLTLDFMESGYDLHILRQTQKERMISVDRLLQTLNGLEYRARTLEKTCGGNEVLRKLVPKVVEETEPIRILPTVQCNRCYDWERNTDGQYDYGYCSRYCCQKHERGFCDEGRKKTQSE